MSNLHEIETLELNRSDIEGFSLFPLPCVAMENYMLWTAQGPFPNSFRITIVFEGILERTALFESFLKAIRRHPMLCASISVENGLESWSLPERVAFCTMQGIDFSEHPFGVEWDLTRSPGIRFWYVIQSNNTELTLEFHHASTDGQGAQQLIHDWFVFYHERDSSTGAHRVPKLEPEKLQKRNEYPPRKQLVTAEETLSLWKKMELAYRFHFELPDELRIGRTLPKEPSQECFQRWVVEPDAKQRAMEGMKQRGMNLTEWTMWITALAMKDWIMQNSGRCRRLRVMVPTSHRTYDDRRLPACNRIGFAFVSLGPQSLSAPEAMASEIQAQMSGIRRYRLGMDFLEQLQAVGRYRWLAKRLLNLDRCWTTAVVSSLGDIGTRVQRLLPKSEYGTQTSSAHISQVFGFPPIRHRCHLAVGVCQQSDEIFLGFRTFLSQNQSTRFVELFKDQWFSCQDNF